MTCCFHTYFLLRTETNEESQQGVVGNTTMGNLTTVKRAAEVFAKKKGMTIDKVTSAALQSFMTETSGNYDTLPTTTYVSCPQTYSSHLTGSTVIQGLSGGNVNRNLSMVNALHASAFDLLVSMEGRTQEDLKAQYHQLTGGNMADNEGTLN